MHVVRQYRIGDNKMKGDYTKVGFNVSNDLLVKIDEYAKSLYINRSSAICVLVSQALEQKKALDTLENIPNLIAELEAKKALQEAKK